MIQKLYTIGIVCLGASTGSVLRFMVYSLIGRTFQDTYLATLIVNILGSFFIGILFVVFNQIHSPRLQLLLMTGLLASFTTFSTLSLDALKLFTNGQIAIAFGHVGGQIIFGISFCYLGVKIGQKLF
ncbi:MAG: fluoride efflux transporter FluC [Ostreibacterium sp.]